MTCFPRHHPRCTINVQDLFRQSICYILHGKKTNVVLLCCPVDVINVPLIQVLTLTSSIEYKLSHNKKSFRIAGSLSGVKLSVKHMH